jgi:hypothetical protein
VRPSPSRISIELTNRCRKGCSFCYNGSDAHGETTWTDDDVVALVNDCADHGVQAVSFGGGEPLEYPGVLAVLARLRGVLARTLTTHGLLLDEPTLDRLVAAAPEKVHVSIHQPGRAAEVERVIATVDRVQGRGIAAGVNLLVARSQLAEATAAATALRAAGIGPERVVYLPMRGRDTPAPEELARVAGGPRFQSTTCLMGCAASPRFCSLGWDRAVGWCSYTRTRAALGEPSYAGLQAALDGLGLAFCGEDGALPRRRLAVLA